MKNGYKITYMYLDYYENVKKDIFRCVSSSTRGAIKSLSSYLKRFSYSLISIEKCEVISCKD